MSAAHLKGPPAHFEHRRGCTLKVGYDSEADAIREQRKFGNIKHRPYRCENCGCWHNTMRGKRPEVVR